MAKPIRKREPKRKALKDVGLPLSRENFMIIGAGLVVITLGYTAMALGGIEGFLSLVLAPILLLVGYCVIVPIGILYRKPYAKHGAEEGSAGEPAR